MLKLKCVASCYLPTGKLGKKVILERYEDQTYPSDPEGNIYEMSEKDAQLALASGNFVPVEE